MTGYVKSWIERTNNRRPYGFLRTDVPGPDVFLTLEDTQICEDGCFREPGVGVRYDFEIQDYGRGPRAVNARRLPKEEFGK